MADADGTGPDRVVVARSRLRVGLGAAVVLLLLGLAASVLVSAFGAAGESHLISPEVSGRASESAGDGSADDAVPVDPQATGPPTVAVFVHLLGAVSRPGLYQLREGDRVVDAIAAASGFTDTADQRAVNLARRIIDGEQIYVPTVGEVVPPTVSGGGATSIDPASRGERVNLNTADEAALDTLPGVGPSTASSIISWREENGRFTSIEDLLSVDGIGDKTFAALKDLVTV